MLCYELLYTFISPLFPCEKRFDLLVVYFIINDKCFEMSGRNNRQIYECWMTIQDIIGRASLWPVSIRRYFWTPNLKLWQRTLVATFVFINGLNPTDFMDWVELLHFCSDSEAIRHFEYLFSTFESNPRRYNLYGYNVSFFFLFFYSV